MPEYDRPGLANGVREWRHEEVPQRICSGVLELIPSGKTGGAGEPQPTGLSAPALMQSRPQTRHIAYKTVGENGRTLYAVAANRWLETAVILDKSSDEGAPGCCQPARSQPHAACVAGQAHPSTPT
jgi:hypothetical protein